MSKETARKWYRQVLHDLEYELTPDYTLLRYPDVSEIVPYEQYSEEVAKEKLEIAKKVLNYLKKRWGEL